MTVLGKVVDTFKGARDESCDCAQRYRELKALAAEDPVAARRRAQATETPGPECLDEACVRLRALLWRDEAFYVETLAPFEFALRKALGADAQRRYERLVTVFRDEYFAFQERPPSYRFMLTETDDDIERLAQAYVLSHDETPLRLFVKEHQARLDAFAARHGESDDARALRTGERELLDAYERELLRLIATIHERSRALAELLEHAAPVTLDADDYALSGRFQRLYDLLDARELEEYLGAHPDTSAEKDIALMRALTQRKIVENNREAEAKLAKTGDKTVSSEILTAFASNEQEILSRFRTQAVRYMASRPETIDAMQIEAPFDLFFDHYFADFERMLAFYKQRYATAKPQRMTQTPYYLQMLGAVRYKLTVTVLVARRERDAASARYVEDERELPKLRAVDEKAALDIENLIEEFDRYAQVYIDEIYENETDAAVHRANVEALRERFRTEG